MDRQHFTLIVAGDNPEELIKPYSKYYKTDKTKVFEFAKAKEYQDKYIKMYEEMSKLDSLSEEEKKSAESIAEYYRSITTIDFYLDLTEELEVDEETGDAYTTKNINGFYDSCKLGKNLSMPLIDKNGKETFSEIKSNIDWDKIHLNNKETYEFVWDSIMEGKKPETEEEEKLYNNMKNRKAYFEKFGNKENYIASNTSFWGYAFLDENGWVQLNDTDDQFKWVINFYNRFIVPLDDKTLISVYECVYFENN